jgi:hypothetical protein
MIVVLLVASFLMCLSLSGDYYVSTSGNDMVGDGAINNPFKTISTCVSRIDDEKPTIHLISEGRYYESMASYVMSSRSIVVQSDSNNNVTSQVIGKIFVVRDNSNLTLNSLAFIFEEKFGLVDLDQNCSLFMESCSINQTSLTEFSENLFVILGTSYFSNTVFTNLKLNSSICTVFSGNFEGLYFNNCQIVNISTTSETRANVAPLIHVDVEGKRFVEEWC